jgi:uncharacterized membrane protein YgdD (TMEM256/DUF423 family)
MDKKIFLTALSFGFVSIVLGAFGAHSLKKNLTIDQLCSFETGVKYMMYHSLFLLFIGTSQALNEQQKKIIFYLITIGTILFSCSIFILSTSTLTGFYVKFMGPITPLGGLLLMVSWAITFYYIIVKKA